MASVRLFEDLTLVGVLETFDGSSTVVRLDSQGNLKNITSLAVGLSTTTARVSIFGGTSTKAPLNIGAGSFLTVPSPGAIESDGVSLTFTNENSKRIVLNPYASTRTLTGFEDSSLDSASNLSTVSFTGTTFTVTGTNFPVWVLGTRFIKSTQNLTISTTEGLHYIFYSSTGVLQESMTPFDLSSCAPVAVVYYSSSRSVLTDQRFNVATPWTLLDHYTNLSGTYWVSGFDPTNFSSDGTSFSITPGVLRFADIKFTVAQTQTLCILTYRSSSSWKGLSSSGAYISKASTTMNWNSSGTLTAATLNRFVAYWIYATAYSDVPIFSVVGERQDLSLAEAKLNNVAPPMVGFPSPSHKLIYRVILKQGSGVITKEDVTDYRSSGGTSSFSGSHAMLTDLSYANSGHTGFEPSLTKGNLTAGDSVLSVTGGTGSVIGSGVTISVNQSSISHSSISGIGTYSHTQIDTELSRLSTTSGTNTGDISPSNPTASVGLSAINGSATTYMRSDASPKINVDITPTWTGTHTFGNTGTSAKFLGSVGIGIDPTSSLDVLGKVIVGTVTTAAQVLVCNRGLLPTDGSTVNLSSRSSGGVTLAYAVVGSATTVGTWVSTTPTQLKRSAIELVGSRISFFQNNVSTSAAINAVISMSETLTLSEEGRLGIGVTAPSVPLHVQGDMSLSGTDPLSYTTATGTLAFGGAGVQTIYASGSTGYLRFQTNASTSPVLVLATDGKVGIGTATASAALSIYKTNFIHLAPDSGRLEFTASGEKVIAATTAGGYLSFRVNGSTTNALSIATNNDVTIAKDLIFGASGPKMVWDSANSRFSLLNSTGSANAPLVCGGLTVNGTLTYIQTTDLKVSDNIIELSTGVVSAPVSSGILAHRGSSTSASLVWVEAEQAWKCGLEGSEVAISLSTHTHSYLPLSGGTMTGAISPNGNSTVDLGASGTKWKTIYATTFSGTASNATTTEDTSGTLYPLGVTSAATTTLKRNTAITMVGGAVAAASLTLSSTLSVTGTTTLTSLVAQSATFSGTLTANNGIYLPSAKSITWQSVNGRTPFIGHTSDSSSDGSFSIGINGTTTSTTLTWGGASGNLLWKGSILLDASNYTTYAPTKTGTGASGTWGISITGTASTVTTGATTAAIYVSGVQSGTLTSVKYATAVTITNGALSATSFSGSGASLTSLNASSLSSGTVPIDRLPMGTDHSSAAYGDHTHAFSGVPGLESALSAKLDCGTMLNPAVGVPASHLGQVAFNFQALKSGYPLFTDPEFASSAGGCNAYFLNGTLSRVLESSDTDIVSPSGNSSGYSLKLTVVGVSTVPSTQWGGFCQNFTSRANATFIHVFRAKIPAGYSLNLISNDLGTASRYFPLTSTSGTGRWEWYAYVAYCGHSGTFSTGGFVYLSGSPSPTPANPLIWYVSYSNIIDITKSNYDGLRTRLADSALSANATVGVLSGISGVKITNGFDGSANKDVSLDLAYAPTWTGKHIFTGTVQINGASSTKPLMVSNIVGQNGSGTLGTLSLQFGANALLYLGNTSAYSISADGSSYTGNSATATKLASSVAIQISGAVTGSANFDGSAAIDISTSVNHTHSQYINLDGSTSFSAPYGLWGTAASTSACFHDLLNFTPSVSATGIIKIDVPGPFYRMRNIKIVVFNRALSTSGEILISGHTDTGNSVWNNYSVFKSTEGLPSVRLCQTSSSSKFSILLGALATTWSYARVTVSESFSHSGALSDLERTGWSASLISSETGLINMVVPVSNAGFNADTLDGYHAGNAANNLLLLDSSGLVPYADLPVGTGSSQVAQGSHAHDIYLPKSGGTMTGDLTIGSDSANKNLIVNGSVLADAFYITSTTSTKKFKLDYDEANDILVVTQVLS